MSIRLVYKSSKGRGALVGLHLGIGFFASREHLLFSPHPLSLLSPLPCLITTFDGASSYCCTFEGLHNLNEEKQNCLISKTDKHIHFFNIHFKMFLIDSLVDLGWVTKDLKFSNSGIYASRLEMIQIDIKIDIERETVESAISTIISQFVRIKKRLLPEN